MSAGLIPIVTNVGDAQLIVGDVEKVVASRNPELIVRALRRVSELPLAERQSKAQQARKRIAEQFSLSLAIDRYARLYDAA
jgi:glycosyltransferase involved in cell wall biosynthesis